MLFFRYQQHMHSKYNMYTTVGTVDLSTHYTTIIAYACVKLHVIRYNKFKNFVFIWYIVSSNGEYRSSRRTEEGVSNSC